MERMTERADPQPDRTPAPRAERKRRVHLAVLAGWGVLSIAATVLQNAPDLLEWLPTEVIWGLVVIGALAQLPFIARDALRGGRPRDEAAGPFWREGHGDNLLHPEPHFVGYREQRRRMQRLFAAFTRPGWRGALDLARWWRRPGPQTPPLVVVVTGAPGTGKSQLANLVARETADRFPDGARWVDLTTGTSADDEDAGTAEEEAGTRRTWLRMPDVLPRRFRRLRGDRTAPAPAVARPRSVHTLLEELLGASGDTPRGPRRQLEEAWRGRTAGRRLLLVLENAEDPRQVQPLLPNSPDSAVLVTARRPFHDAGFAFTEVHLEGLTEDEGAELLDRQAPIPADTADPGRERRARRAVAEHCHGLPLALKMCGKRLASHTGEDAERLLAKLRSTHGTPLLGPTGFPASFLGVFRLCGTEARRLLHRMADSGMQEAADYAAAALLGIGRERAAGVLTELVELSLLEPLGRADDGVRRYRMHQLVRDTMVVLGPAELGVPPAEAEAEWGPEATAAAARRLVEAYTWTARATAAELHGDDPGFPAPPLAGPPPDPAAAAFGLEAPGNPPAWLHRESEVLLGCIWLAADGGHTGAGWRLSRAVAEMCKALRTHWEEWEQAVEAQLALAYGGGDPQALAMALLEASELSGARGRYQQGAVYARRALLVFERLGADERWAARAHRALGVCLQRWGDLGEAQEELERAEAVLAEHGERRWHARTLYDLAQLHADLGRREKAAGLLRRARDAFAAEGDTAQRDQVRIMLAEVLADEGRHLDAWIALQSLLEGFRGQGRHWFAAQCLRVLGGLDGELLRRQWRAAEGGGRPTRRLRRAWSTAERTAQLREAIVLMERMGDLWGVNRTRLTLARALVHARDFDGAERTFRRAARGFADLGRGAGRDGEQGDLRWQARTHHAAAEEILAVVSPAREGADPTVPLRYARPLQLALVHAREALDLYEERGNASGVAGARILLARILWVDGADRAEVLGHLEAAARRAAEAALPDLQKEARDLHARLSSAHPDVARLWEIH